MSFFDLHVHAAPSLFPRQADGVTLAAQYAHAGASGFLLKHHHGSSVEAAAALQALHPGMDVHGGLVLNQFVGGVNAFAVDAAVALGAKMIWLPTLHASAHERACGCLGGFTFQQPATRLDLCEGIDLLDDQGTLWPQVHEVLDVLHGRGVALGTGHVSREEVFAVHAAIRERKLDVPLVVNHVFFDVPNLAADDLTALHGDGVFFEIVELSTQAKVGATTVAEVARMLQQHPDWNWILASDGGQVDAGPPPKRLDAFRDALQAAGVSVAALERYLERHPRAALGL